MYQPSFINEEVERVGRRHLCRIMEILELQLGDSIRRGLKKEMISSCIEMMKELAYSLEHENIHDGYADGYDEGYNDGYVDGYDSNSNTDI